MKRVSWMCSPRWKAEGGGQISQRKAADDGAALLPNDGGAPVVNWRWRADIQLRLVVAVPVDSLACSGDAPSWRIGERTSDGARRQGPAAL
jgi:hypothetical protein